MIVKEYHPTPTSDRFQRAGDEAELQMAHYLKRAFADNPNVHVFNNLRLEHNGEVAQIDHLIFHRAGFIIVESKSVTSSVRINEREEWARQWNGRWSGMPSPVLQAKRQAELLRALLQENREHLRNKIMFGLRQGGFRAFIIDVVVAISDKGVIQHRGKLPEVKKADQVPDYLRELMASHSRVASVFGKETREDDMGFNLSPEELPRIISFLRNRHQDRPTVELSLAVEEVAAPSQSQDSATLSTSTEPMHTLPAGSSVRETAHVSGSASAGQPTCAKCGSTELEVKFGHSYYFHCLKCGGNSPVKLSCPTCGTAARTRKSGKQFYRDCAKCGTSELFYTNL